MNLRPWLADGAALLLPFLEVQLNLRSSPKVWVISHLSELRLQLCLWTVRARCSCCTVVVDTLRPWCPLACTLLAGGSAAPAACRCSCTLNTVVVELLYHAPLHTTEYSTPAYPTRSQLVVRTYSCTSLPHWYACTGYRVPGSTVQITVLPRGLPHPAGYVPPKRFLAIHPTTRGATHTPDGWARVSRTVGGASRELHTGTTELAVTEVPPHRPTHLTLD